MVPGAPALDAPLGDGHAAPWLLRRVASHGFTALVFGDAATALALRQQPQGAVAVNVLELPAQGVAAERYDAQGGTVYLLRPDQHVCARWRRATPARVQAAMQRALALN